MRELQNSYRYITVRLVLAFCFFVFILTTLILNYSNMSVFYLFVLNILFCGKIILIRTKEGLDKGKVYFSLLTFVVLVNTLIYTLVEDFLNVHFLHIIQNGYMYGSCFILIYLFREWFWLRNRLPNRKIKNMMGILPKFSRVYRNKIETKISSIQIGIGDEIIVKEMERIPCDGVIIKGETFIDEKLLTGSDLLVTKTNGSLVYAGTLNCGEKIHIKANSTFKTSIMTRILHSLMETKDEPLDYLLILDDLAGYLLVGFVVFATVLYLLLISIYGWMFWIQILNGILVASMVIINIGVICAEIIPIILIKKLSLKKGIGIQNIHALYSIKTADSFVFNKKGTLTVGIEIVDCHVNKGSSKSEILNVLHSVGSYCQEPFKSIFMEYGKEIKTEKLSCKVDKIIKGKGLIAITKKNKFTVGTENFLKENHVQFKNGDNEPSNAIYIAKDRKVMGKLVMHETIREGGIELINFLQKKGKEIILLSGNSQKSVEPIAKILKIDKVNANVLPTTKSVIVNNLRLIGKKVVVIGSAFNDLMALFRGNVAIGIANNTSLIYENFYDIIIHQQSLSAIQNLFKLNTNLRKAIVTNILILFVVNGGFVSFLLFESQSIVSWWWFIIEIFATIPLIVINSVRLLK